MERDKLFVVFDWTSEVDDIAGGGGDAVIVFSSICRLHVVYNVCYFCCAVCVSMVSSGGEEGSGSAHRRRVVIAQAHGSSLAG